MNNLLARFRQAGSFTAGLLIGVSIMIPMFAMMVTNLGDWQIVWVVGALIVFAFGLKLQLLLTVKSRHRRTIALALGVLPVSFPELQRER